MSADPVAATVAPEDVIRLPQSVVYRVFAAETVVLNLETGRYHGLNPTGGRMLAELESCGQVRATAERLARDYGRPVDEMLAELCSFCASLEDRGLIEVQRGA
ncbi:MAG: PqqD family protein [Solirubrobacterales bacterium]|nr:PqqD family protein [Solirubrobacterales bacterium]